MAVPDKVLELVERFDNNIDAYKKGKYNETQVRREFIDPLFTSLSWDVDNEQSYAEAYKDVVHEDAIKIGRATKAPDYSFRIGGVRKFFVEAKKPSIDIKEDTHPAYQLRRYAWSAKLPLSILTDFEELAVYDCRMKPEKIDRASKARVMYLTYTNYADKWDELANTFSREAILKGAFDKYAESHKAKKGTAEVDVAFLQEIERWRGILARNIALRNPKLNRRELNFAVQRTIDRIIFLRICEDRGIEDYGKLMALQNGSQVYERMLKLFYQADDRYNSGIFHFRKEHDHAEVPDNLTPDLTIDDTVLKDILKNIYYPDSPYEFSVLSADILGQVYEQFLGKIIRLTAGHQAKVEEKPEVKKAGGVFYTPTYIVEYIVRHTVDELLKDKLPKHAAKLKILDPACGSGSFLIVAYQHLLDWYRDYYIHNDPHKWNKGRNPSLYQNDRGEWKLTIEERKRILLSNIYGVDIDSQAVEVTKLSLLLKVLEGEDEQTINSQLTLFQKRVLPDLSNNIKCGNSLISSNFFDGKQLTLLDEEEMYRVNAFDWNDEYSEILRGGGFDAVIGNPPYVDIKSLPTPEVRYLFSQYHSANNRINLFAVFIEKMFELVNQRCFSFSMIVPTALLTQDSYKALRKDILQRFRVTNIVRLPNESFGNAAGDVKVDTAIFVFTDNRDGTDNNVEVIAYAGYNRIDEIEAQKATVHGFISQASWDKHDDCVWFINYFNKEEHVISKIEHDALPLVNYADFSLGITPYDKYKGHTQDQIKSKVFHAEHQKDQTFKRLLAGNDVRRYYVEWNGEKWISYGTWLGAPREQRFFTQKHILVKQIIDWSSKRIWATTTIDELYNTQNAFNLLPKTDVSLEYLLGILNSRLMTFYHQKKYLDEFKMRFQKILIKDCKRFPIHEVNLSDPAAIAQHDKMVQLVTAMLELHTRKASTIMQREQELYQRQITAIDRQIDNLVYELYGLTDEEIQIIEASG